MSEVDFLSDIMLEFRKIGWVFFYDEELNCICAKRKKNPKNKNITNETTSCIPIRLSSIMRLKIRGDKPILFGHFIAREMNGVENLKIKHD